MGLTEIQKRVLEALRDVRHSPADIARFLKITPPTVSNHLKKLRKEGYVKKRRGVKGAGSYALSKKGVAAISKPREQSKLDHNGWLIVNPASELHKWYADFKVTGGWETHFQWDRCSLPPNQFMHWKDGFDDEDVYGNLLRARRIRFADGKDSRTITIWLDKQVPGENETSADVVRRNTDMALLIASHIQRSHGIKLGLIGICGKPHVALNMNPDIALTVRKAGIRTEDVYVDFSDGADVPHLETDNLRKGIMFETTPEHLEHLYDCKDILQRDQVKMIAKVMAMEENNLHRDNIIESLLKFVTELTTSVDKLADAQLKRDLDTETMVSNVMNRIQNKNDKKKPKTDPGDMFQ